MELLREWYLVHTGIGSARWQDGSRHLVTCEQCERVRKLGGEQKKRPKGAARLPRPVGLRSGLKPISYREVRQIGLWKTPGYQPLRWTSMGETGGSGKLGGCCAPLRSGDTQAPAVAELAHLKEESRTSS